MHTKQIQHTHIHRTYINPYNNIKTHRHTFTYKHKHTHPNKPIYLNRYIHICINPLTQPLINTYTQHTYMHTETNAHTIQTHISYIHKCIHGHIYIHTHIKTKLHTNPFKHIQT